MILGVAHFIATIALYDLITIAYAQQSVYGQCGGIGWYVSDHLKFMMIYWKILSKGQGQLLAYQVPNV